MYNVYVNIMRGLQKIEQQTLKVKISNIKILDSKFLNTNLRQYLEHRNNCFHQNLKVKILNTKMVSDKTYKYNILKFFFNTLPIYNLYQLTQ